MRYLIAILCLASASAAPAEDALPHHTILRAAGPIAVDGHLDEPSWEAAQVIDQFVFPWWTEGAKDRTEARLLWDDVHLYVAFTAHDPPHFSHLDRARRPGVAPTIASRYSSPQTPAKSPAISTLNSTPWARFWTARRTLIVRPHGTARACRWPSTSRAHSTKRRIRIRSGPLRSLSLLPSSIHTLPICPRLPATCGVSTCTARAARSICSTSLGLIPRRPSRNSTCPSALGWCISTASRY